MKSQSDARGLDDCCLIFDERDASPSPVAPFVALHGSCATMRPADTVDVQE